MNDELDKALAECEGHTPGPWDANIFIGTIEKGPWPHNQLVAKVTPTINSARKEEVNANARLIALAPTLAAAVRELRETVKAKDEEIARLQHIVDEKPLTFLRGLEDEAIEKLIQQNDELRSAIRKAAGDLSFLDQALNENDGVYKP